MSTRHRFCAVQIVWILLYVGLGHGEEPKSDMTLKGRPPELIELKVDDVKEGKSIQFHVLLENVSHKRLFLSDEAGTVRITWKNPPPNGIVSPREYSRMGGLRHFELVEAVDLPLAKEGENIKYGPYHFEPQSWIPHEANTIEEYEIEITLVGYEVGVTEPTKYVVSFPPRVKYPGEKDGAGAGK